MPLTAPTASYPACNLRRLASTRATALLVLSLGILVGTGSGVMAQSPVQQQAPSPAAAGGAIAASQLQYGAEQAGKQPATSQTVSAAQGEADASHAAMPAGTIYLYDLDGKVSVQSNSRSFIPERHRTFDGAEPTSFKLERNSSLGLVFSNGAALWVKGPAQFRIDSFRQQPFNGNSRQTTYEPTQSVLNIELISGIFSFAERNLSALSSVQFSFGEGNTLEAHEAAALVLKIGKTSSDGSDRISVLEGRALLYHGNHSTAILIGNSQYIDLSHSDSGLRLPSPLTSEQTEADQSIANHSFIINDRVWFKRDGDSTMLTPQVVIPGNFWLAKPHAPTRIR